MRPGSSSSGSARASGEPALFVEAHRALGVPLFWLGEVTAALEQLEQGAAAYDADRHRSHASAYGIDPGVVCLSYAALALWQLGRPRQALDRSHEALSLARDLSHPQSLALALVWAAWLRQLRREPQPAREHAEAAMALCAEQGFPLWLSMAVILRGWALAEEGQGEEGIARMRQGLADLRATGAGLWRPSFLALLAEAHGRAGRPEEGLGALDEALAMVARNGERAHEAELHRLRGELLLRGRDERTRPRAEACFARRSRSRVGRRPSPSSSAPRPRWRASAPIAAARRGPRRARPGPRLVHRGLRHRGPQGGEDPPRGTGVLVGPRSKQTPSGGLKTERKGLTAHSKPYRDNHGRLPRFVVVVIGPIDEPTVPAMAQAPRSCHAIFWLDGLQDID